jgi:hypothetical protein
MTPATAFETPPELEGVAVLVADAPEEVEVEVEVEAQTPVVFSQAEHQSA